MSELSAFGTELRQGDGGGPESFTPVAQVRDISGPGLSLDNEDVTTHDSTGGWEEVVATILRTGEMTLEIVYDPADGTHDATTGLVADMEAKTLRNFELEWPDATEWSFAAYVTGFEPGAPHDGSLTASVTLKLSGVPTLA